jgi:hypothetical protein
MEEEKKKKEEEEEDGNHLFILLVSQRRRCCAHGDNIRWERARELCTLFIYTYRVYGEVCCSRVCVTPAPHTQTTRAADRRRRV